MTAVAASVRATFVARVHDAHRSAGQFAADRMVEATYREDTEVADRWALAMVRADDQALLILAMLGKGWL